MGALGADAAALERLAGSMRTASRQLGEVALGLERRTRATGWTGPDAARFEREWALRHRPALLALAHRSAGLAVTLDREAAEQRRVSASSGPPASPASVPPTPRVPRPVPISPFPVAEQRFAGGVGVKVGVVTAEIEGDLWLQELPDGRVRVTAMESAMVGVEATVGATAEVTIGGTSSAPTPLGGQAGAGVALGGVLRRSWEVDPDEVPGLLVRVAAAEAAERAGMPMGDPRGEIHLAGRGGSWFARTVGGVADGITEHFTGFDPGFDDRAEDLVTLPAPDRVEALGAVEVAASAGFGALQRLAPSGHAGVNGTIRAGHGHAGDRTSTIVEVQGGAAATLSGSLLGRLGVGLPGSVRELDTVRFELVETGRRGTPDQLLVKVTRTGESSLDELLVRVELEPAPGAGGSPGGVRGIVHHLASGDVEAAARDLLGPLGDVEPTSVTVSGSRGELSGTTVSGSPSLSAIAGVGVSAKGQVLHVDRRH